MGRIEYYWKKAFEKEGYNFLHIGPNQIKNLIHKSLFGFMAYRYYKRLNITPVAFIAHEPVSGYFIKKKIPCFVESHGVERKHWQEELNGNISGLKKKRIKLKTRLLHPLWRLRPSDKGLKYSHKLLLSNNDDKQYVMKRYTRSDKDILVFRNGYDLNLVSADKTNPGTFNILFNGSWLERKGIYTLIQAASFLYAEGIKIEYILIGTGSCADKILLDWPDHLKNHVKVVPFFKKEKEQDYLNAASIFILPSYFEGQPLSLIQAMANGKCCISTNCCGQKDLLIHGKDGFLFEQGNAEELATLIKQCYFNQDVITQIGVAAQEKIKDRSWENVGNEVADYVISNLKILD